MVLITNQLLSLDQGESGNPIPIVHAHNISLLKININMGCITCVLFAIVLILLLFKIYLKLTTGWCTSNVCLVGKTAIVTGANTGILLLCLTQLQNILL